MKGGPWKGIVLRCQGDGMPIKQTGIPKQEVSRGSKHENEREEVTGLELYYLQETDYSRQTALCGKS